MDREAGVTEHPQGHSRGILWRCHVTMDVKHGKVARADKLHRTIVGSSSHDESRELSRESALAENAVGVFHHAIERETGFGEAAEGCMKVAHEHRGSNTLAGNIPQHKEQAAVCFKKIAVIAADHAGRLIVVARVPAIWRPAGLRQESALVAGGQGKIALQGALFIARKMVETEPHQRIGQQALRFDSLVARLAESECSLIDTAQRGVHIRQQLRNRSIGGGRMQSLVKALAALLQFGAQMRLFGSGHTTSCHRLLFCSGAFHPISSFESRSTGIGVTATVSALRFRFAAGGRESRRPCQAVADFYWMPQTCRRVQEFLFQPPPARPPVIEVLEAAKLRDKSER